ncbi:unnamed protein product [Lymnaea stagnalis]|uniref:NIDO domain-containing protein n=1 Tax=Lymnaea stagnalis TaxID=6523 RepID=A0AAV2HL54_LYMST
MTAPFRATVLSRAAQDLKKYYNLSSFEVDTVLVVTWVGVEPFKHFQQEKNTFQAIFISGWNSEYQNGHGLLKGEETSYVIFLYQQGQMNWTYKPGQPINVGFTGFALPDTDTLLVSMLDKINGNTGEQGVYTYLTGQSSGPIQACHRYICNNLALLSDPVYEYDKTDLFKCPCTMERLGHQWQLFQTRGENHDIQCYAISHLAKIRLKPNNKRNKLCCYKMGKPKHPEDWRDVEQTRREASYVLSALADSGHVLINEPWPEFYFNIDEVLENVEAHKICCADATRELCNRFYQIFPDMGCTDFVEFVTGKNR